MPRKNANVRRANAKRYKATFELSQRNRRKRFGQFVIDELTGESIPARSKKLGTARKRMAA